MEESTAVRFEFADVALVYEDLEMTLSGMAAIAFNGSVNGKNFEGRSFPLSRRSPD